MFTTFLSSQLRKKVAKNSLSSHNIRSSNFNKKLVQGEVVRGFFKCVNPVMKKKRNGDSFVDLLLMHSSGTLKGRMWDFVDELKDRFVNKSIIAVKGIVDEFDGEFYIKILSVNSIEGKRYEKYGFKKSMINSKILTLK